jgi:hypothetical protein
MTIRLQDRLLSNVLDFRAAQASNPLAGLRQSIEIDLDTVSPSANLSTRPRRTRIWELSSSLHCSIVGTCLSTAELRHVLVQLKVSGMQTADEHDLHSFGVGLAGKRELGAKLLQKALDRRHERAIKAFAATKDTETLRSLWKDALNKGDIPGAYWTVLTHPLTDDALIKLAFGDVHMLSHLVGAANRADIRRLRELEAENAGLTDELRRARQQIRDGFASRDQIILQLNELLAKCDRPEPSQAPDRERDEIVAMEEVIRDLSKKLARDGARRESAEARSAALAAARARKNTSCRCYRKRAKRCGASSICSNGISRLTPNLRRRQAIRSTLPASQSSTSAAAPIRSRNCGPSSKVQADSFSITTAAWSRVWDSCPDWSVGRTLCSSRPTA